MNEYTQPEVTVLVVDDEPLVRSVVTAALRAFGVTVVAAGRGEEAVGLLRAHPARIGAALLDVQMSPWDGPRTLAELRRIEPALPAAFMSGNTGYYSTDDLRAMGAARVFAKPFQDLAGLAAELRELANATNAVGR